MVFAFRSNARKRVNTKAGEWVEVRSKDEIFSTLDDRACLDALPFQPEMLAFAGKRLRVAKVAHKTCDNIRKTGGRRMESAVHLEGARCDGRYHGGCQADCVFFWKEDWLKREGDHRATNHAGAGCSEEVVYKSVQDQGSSSAEDTTWICQTTALFEATSELNWWDFRQYIRDVTSGNHTFAHMARILTFAGYQQLFSVGYGHRFLIAAFNWFQRLRGGKPYPLDVGTVGEGKPTPTEVLNLQPGEWVEVLSQEEILATITKDGFNRGMRYDREMSKYCGERYRVQMRVNKLINEKTGKMMQMKSPCIQLEGVYCRAECTDRRLGCPRASNTYWREIWLRRVDGPAT